MNKNAKAPSLCTETLRLVCTTLRSILLVVFVTGIIHADLRYSFKESK